MTNEKIELGDGRLIFKNFKDIIINRGKMANKNESNKINKKDEAKLYAFLSTFFNWRTG